MAENAAQMSIPKRTAFRALYALGSPFSDSMKLKRAQLLFDLIPNRLPEGALHKDGYFNDTLSIWLAKSDVRKARAAELLCCRVIVKTNIKLGQSFIYLDSEMKRLAVVASKASEMERKASDAANRANENLSYSVEAARSNGNYMRVTRLLENIDIGQPPASLGRGLSDSLKGLWGGKK